MDIQFLVILLTPIYNIYLGFTQCILITWTQNTYLEHLYATN